MKQFRGWAVFTDAGGCVCWTIREKHQEAKDEWMRDFQRKFGLEETWKSSQSRVPTTLRRVIVSEEPKGTTP
jgi:hypothetical protein